MSSLTQFITRSSLYQVLIDPILSKFNFVHFDRSYGRRSIKYEIPSTLRECKIESNYCIINNKDLIHYITVYDPKVEAPYIDVFRVHGMADYAARFLKFAHLYTKNGFRLHLIDLPGHGHSDGVHCYYEVDDCSKALREVINNAKEKYNIKEKAFLKGGSLGGMVILNYALNYKQEAMKLIKGLNFQCPCIKINSKAKPPRFIILIGRLFNLIIPRFAAVPRLKNMCSLDPEIDQLFLSDPMTYHGGLRIRSGFSMEDCTKKFENKLSDFDLPFLVQQGDSDRMIDPSGSQMLMDLAKSKDKSIIWYKNCEHDMYSQSCSNQVFTDSINWLIKRSKLDN